jgi:hypothetical protein
MEVIKHHKDARMWLGVLFPCIVPLCRTDGMLAVFPKDKDKGWIEHSSSLLDIRCKCVSLVLLLPLQSNKNHLDKSLPDPKA